MVVLLFRLTVQGPVPEHPPPDQPVKVDPASAEAVRVTSMPVVKFAWHVEPQLIPAGLLVIVPLPVPVFVTVNTPTATPVPVITTDLGFSLGSFDGMFELLE